MLERYSVTTADIGPSPDPVLLPSLAVAPYARAPGAGDDARNETLAALRAQFGDALVPHIETFASTLNVASRTYWSKADEALQSCYEDAAAMRRDGLIDQLLHHRQIPSSLLDYEIETDDPDDPGQQACAARLEKVIRATPDFQQLRQYLLEDMFQGKYGAQQGFKRRRIDGVPTWCVGWHQPVEGDKIVSRYTDKCPGIQVSAAYAHALPEADRGLVTWNEIGPVLFLDNAFWRDRFIISRFEPIDQPYLFRGAEQAGKVLGWGYRGRLFLTWWFRAELLSMKFDALKLLSTGGQRVMTYEYGNPKSKADVELFLRELTEYHAAALPVVGASQGKVNPADLLMAIPPATAAYDVINDAIAYMDAILRLDILGQNLSSQSSPTGLNSGLAELQGEVRADYIEYDARRLQETLTRDMIGPLVRLNDWEYGGRTWAGHLPFEMRLKFKLERRNVKEIIEACQVLHNLNLPLDADELRSLVGVKKPREKGTVILGALDQQAQAQQMAMQQQAMAQPGGMPPAGPGGAPAAQGPELPPEGPDASPMAVEGMTRERHAADRSGAQPPARPNRGISSAGLEPRAASGDATVSKTLVPTPDFASWFKGSKVTHPDTGEPLPVFHGTDSEFGDFGRTRDLGFHFGTQQQAEQRVSGNRPIGKGQVVAAHLAITNPITLPDHAWDTPATMAHHLARIGHDPSAMNGPMEDEEQAADALENLDEDRPLAEYRAEKKSLQQARDDARRQAFAAARDVLKRAGHDGVRYQNTVEGPGESWIAFHPEQIRPIPPHSHLSERYAAASTAGIESPAPEAQRPAASPPVASAPPPAVTAPAARKTRTPKPPPTTVFEHGHNPNEPAYVNQGRRRKAFLGPRIEEGSKRRGIAPEEYLGRVGSGVQRAINRAQFYVRVPTPGVLHNVLTEGRFKTQFETGHSQGAMNPSLRRREEARVMGVPQAHPDEHRPVYGYLGRRDFRGLLAENGVDQYGNTVVRLKPHVRHRATFTLGDSLQSTVQATPAARVEPLHLQPQYGPDVLETLEKHDTADKFLDDLHRRYGYPEVQYHGGLSADDIRDVMFHREPPAHVRDALAKRNIPYRVDPRAGWDRHDPEPDDLDDDDYGPMDTPDDWADPADDEPPMDTEVHSGVDMPAAIAASIEHDVPPRYGQPFRLDRPTFDAAKAAYDGTPSDGWPATDEAAVDSVMYLSHLASERAEAIGHPVAVVVDGDGVFGWSDLTKGGTMAFTPKKEKVIRAFDARGREVPVQGGSQAPPKRSGPGLVFGPERSAGSPAAPAPRPLADLDRMTIDRHGDIRPGAIPRLDAEDHRLGDEASRRIGRRMSVGQDIDPIDVMRAVRYLGGEASQAARAAGRPTFVLYSPTYGYLWSTRVGDYPGAVAVRAFGPDGREVAVTPPAPSPPPAAPPVVERHAAVRRHLERYTRSTGLVPAGRS